jgi:hypothetical protein
MGCCRNEDGGSNTVLNTIVLGVSLCISFVVSFYLAASGTCVPCAFFSFETLIMHMPPLSVLQLLLVAGIVANDWVPMVNLIAVLLVPVAVILTDTLGGGAADFNSSYTEGKAVWANFGTCFFGVILTSMFGTSLLSPLTAAAPAC